MEGGLEMDTDNFKIDKYNLDEEVGTQVDIMEECGAVHADLVEQRDLAKNEMEKVSAELQLSIRKNPNKYGLIKVTDTAANSVIILDSNYQEAYKKYLQVRKEEQLAANEKEMALQRRAYLKILAELWIAGYYATPDMKDKELEREILNKRKRR
jgi:hypothetical protein